MDRRNFLKTLAAVAAWACLPTADLLPAHPAARSAYEEAMRQAAIKWAEYIEHTILFGDSPKQPKATTL